MLKLKQVFTLALSQLVIRTEEFRANGFPLYQPFNGHFSQVPSDSEQNLALSTNVQNNPRKIVRLQINTPVCQKSISFPSLCWRGSPTEPLHR